MKCVAVIPARGGSKRIPGKNKKNFLGKPIISYVIETVISSNLFDEVMVSTDDSEIAEISKSCGAVVPVMRSSENSDDHASLADVINEVDAYYNESGIVLKTICCILPTAVLTSAENLKASHDYFIHNDFDTVLPVTEFSYPIQRSLRFVDESKVVMAEPQYMLSRSQDLESRFHDAGQFYWLRMERFRADQRFFTDNTGAIKVNETAVQDIDNESDWKMAELKYKLIHGEA